jgi:hypothetical protein
MSNAPQGPQSPRSIPLPDGCLTFSRFKPNVLIDTQLPASFSPFVDNGVCRDAQGATYRIEGKRSAWRLVVEDAKGTKSSGLPGSEFTRIELNDRPARPAKPPAVLLFNSNGLMKVLLPERDAATGALKLPTPIEVTTDSLLSPVHSGGGNSVLSHGDHVFVAYPSKTPPSSGVGTDQYVAVVNRQTKQVLRKVLVGNSRRGAASDPHDVPAITMDAAGVLHVVLGGHHADLQYCHSTSIDGSTFSEPVIVPQANAPTGHTYVGLVCDADDRLHVVTRYSGYGYRFKLVYNSRKADGTWDKQRDLIHPGRTMYICWYHRLLLGEDGRRLVLSSAGAIWGQIGKDEIGDYNRMWPCELPFDTQGYPEDAKTDKMVNGTWHKGQQNHSGLTLESADGGKSWASLVYDEPRAERSANGATAGPDGLKQAPSLAQLDLTAQVVHFRNWATGQYIALLSDPRGGGYLMGSCKPDADAWYFYQGAGAAPYNVEVKRTPIFGFNWTFYPQRQADASFIAWNHAKRIPSATTPAPPHHWTLEEVGNGLFRIRSGNDQYVELVPLLNAGGGPKVTVRPSKPQDKHQQWEIFANKLK